MLDKMIREYSLKTQRSRALYERAMKVLPSGVSYGIRYFEPYPFYTGRAKGSKLHDVDGNEYVDFWLGHTTLILGHSPPAIVQAVSKQICNGTHYGTSHELEVQMAEEIVDIVPSAEMVRFTNSGTEANMYATRLVRAYSGKSQIAKFEGGWHGGYDALQVGVKYPFDVAESAGLTKEAVQNTVLLPFNDLDGVTERLKGKSVASIIVEPVLGSGGGIPADVEFLKGLRELCDSKGILLIFDEVITGFRLAPGGAQEYFGVTPDITILGKILGGGFPIGAICGNSEIMGKMDSLKHERPNYSFHGGTFTGNPIAMTAGMATLDLLRDGHLIEDLNTLGERTRKQLYEVFHNHNVNVCITGCGSLFNVHFTDHNVNDAIAASKTDRKRLLEYDLQLITKGVFFLPTHNGALCTEHSKTDMEKLFLETENFAEQR